MGSIDKAEMRRRQIAVESTIGTHAMEGIPVDAKTRDLMRQYAEGELDLKQFSSAMQAYGRETVREIQRRKLVGAA